MPSRFNKMPDHHEVGARRRHASAPGAGGVRREPTDRTARPGPDGDHGADPRSAHAAVGFVCLALPAEGAAGLHLIARAEACLDCTSGPGPRLGWPLPVKWIGPAGTARCAWCAWCGERRGLADLPDNPAASALAARLGHTDPEQRAGLRGDVLLAGVADGGAPTDVPTAAVDAAVDAGMLAPHAVTWPSPHARPVRVGLLSVVAG